MLLAAIDEKHKGTYDFFYLPIDFKVTLFRSAKQLSSSAKQLSFGLMIVLERCEFVPCTERLK